MRFLAVPPARTTTWKSIGAKREREREREIRIRGFVGFLFFFRFSFFFFLFSGIGGVSVLPWVRD